MRMTPSADRRSVALVASASELAVVQELAKSTDPSLRLRRSDGQPHLSFLDADRLLHTEQLPEVEVDPVLQRMIDNRTAVQTWAPAVLDESRAIMRAGAVEARDRIRDSVLADRLDDHQAVNVSVMTLDHGWGACVFDEQGTGKTPTMIAAFDLLVEKGEADVLLVVAPKSMIAEWAEEFRRFCGNLYRVAVADGSRAERARAIDSGADVVVVNYETALSLGPNLRLLAQRARVVMAVDESFFVKNPNTGRASAVASLREWCTRCFVLCGTPAPNRPHDLVAQFDLVDFGHTFRDVRLDDDRDLAASQVGAVLESRGFFLRNLKSQVLPTLSARIFTEVGVDMAPDQADAYRAALDDLILDLSNVTDDAYARSITSFLERRGALLRICSDPAPVIPGYDEVPAKFQALDVVLADLIENRREKVVVWSFYRASLDRIARSFSKYGLVRVDGSVTSVADRRDAVRRFQEDDETMIFLGNPAAAGAGLTLHRSRVAVYESLSNQAAHFLQSLDRIHRRGQDREVEYLALLCRGTIEEVEYRRLLDKADRQADLLSDPSAPRPTRAVLLDELIGVRGLLVDEGTT